MPSDYDDRSHGDRPYDDRPIEAQDVMEGVRAVLLAPILLPLASTVSQPLVKSALKEAIAFSERCQDAVAEAQERLDDILAEARADVDRAYQEARLQGAQGGAAADAAEEHPSEDAEASPQRTLHRSSAGTQISASSFSAYHTRSQHPGEPSDSAIQLQNVITDINNQFKGLTNGAVDLRFLLSLGLGIFALRQIMVKGLELDSIPWYAFAWYALDSFSKYNDVSTASTPAAEPDAPTTIEIESAA